MRLPQGFDLRGLEVFVYVVELRSMTAAGKRLGMTQPAVSYAIGALEKAVARELIDRSTRPPSVTHAGWQLYERAVDLLAEARATAGYLQRPHSGPAPYLRIETLESTAEAIDTHLAPRLGELAHTWSVWSGLTEDANSALMNREVDLIVSARPHDQQPHVNAFALLREPYILALPAGLPGSVQRLADVPPGLGFVSYSARSHSGQRVQQYLARLRLRPRTCIEFDHTSSVLAMVRAGLGWAITTPLCVLSNRTGADGIRIRRLPESRPERAISLVARAQELGDVPHRFAHMLREVLLRRYQPQATTLDRQIGRDFHVGIDEPRPDGSVGLRTPA